MKLSENNLPSVPVPSRASRYIIKRIRYFVMSRDSRSRLEYEVLDSD